MNKSVVNVTVELDGLGGDAAPNHGTESAVPERRSVGPARGGRCEDHLERAVVLVL